MQETLTGWGQKIGSKVKQKLPGEVASTLNELGQKIKKEGAILPDSELVELSSNLIRGGYASDTESLTHFLLGDNRDNSKELNEKILDHAVSRLNDGSSPEELEGRFAISDFLSRKNLNRPTEIPEDRLLYSELISKVKETPVYKRNLKQLSLGVRGALRLGQKDSAIKFTEQLLAKPSVEAPEYAKIVRDIEDEWTRDPGDLIKGSILTSLYLRRTIEPNLEIADTIPGHSDQEANLLFQLNLTEDLMLNSAAMVRAYRIAIERAPDSALGSGFLIRGGSLGLDDGYQWHAVTNAHVVSDDPEEWAGDPAASPKEDILIFPKWSGDKGLKLDKILRTSPRSKHDFTIASLKEDLDEFDGFPAEIESYPVLAKHAPTKGTSLVGLFGARRNIGMVKLGKFHNEADGHIFYDMETFSGYSGGPILNNIGEILGLHSAKPPGQKLRRGTHIQSLIRDHSLFT